MTEEDKIRYALKWELLMKERREWIKTFDWERLNQLARENDVREREVSRAFTRALRSDD